MYMHALSTVLEYHPNWQPRRPAERSRLIKQT
jgi:hypothetical protein